MIKINNIEYRNLEEQVQYNSNNIQRIIEGEELLARLGIKVVGRFDTEAELLETYPAASYQGEFGDAMLIGTETPYDYYIFTRPFEGEIDPQWFNLGPFPVAGPQGPRGNDGERGPEGKRGSLWFSNSTAPDTTQGYEVGDYLLIPSVSTAEEGAPGSIYHLHDEEGVRRWIFEGNIRGPQGVQGPRGLTGPQGPQGEQGPEGPMGPAASTVEIIGIYPSIDNLRENRPAIEAPRNAGALVGSAGNYNVWIIAGEEDNLEWVNAGPFNAGSVVTVNGISQQTWNADTKLTTGASLDYALGTGLRVYQMSNGSRSSNYGGIRQDGVLEARAGTNNSSQLAAGAATVTTPTGGSLRVTPTQMLYKPSGSNTWYPLNIPVKKAGTFALTSDITTATTALENKLMPFINDKNIISTSNYKAAGKRDEILLKPGDGKIMILRANDTSKKWTFRYSSRDAGYVEVKAQLMIAFIPSNPYSTSGGWDVYRPWIIKIDQGTIVPSVEAHTYDAVVYEYYTSIDLAEHIIGEFIPPSDCATDVYEMFQ